jgi:hypothetical protein
MGNEADEKIFATRKDAIWQRRLSEGPPLLYRQHSRFPSESSTRARPVSSVNSAADLQREIEILHPCFVDDVPGETQGK